MTNKDIEKKMASMKWKYLSISLVVIILSLLIFYFTQFPIFLSLIFIFLGFWPGIRGITLFRLNVILKKNLSNDFYCEGIGSIVDTDSSYFWSQLLNIADIAFGLGGLIFGLYLYFV